MADDAQVQKVIALATERAETAKDERTGKQLDAIDEAAGHDWAVLDHAFQTVRHEKNPANWADVADALTEAAQHGGHQVYGVPGIAIGPGPASSGQ
jgi:hypothetical protein